VLRLCSIRIPRGSDPFQLADPPVFLRPLPHPFQDGRCKETAIRFCAMTSAVAIGDPSCERDFSAESQQGSIDSRQYRGLFWHLPQHLPRCLWVPVCGRIVLDRPEKKFGLTLLPVCPLGVLPDA
jgi:hypothetical protein